MSRILVLTACVLVACAVTYAPAGAQALAGYDVANAEWNGLSSLKQLVEDRGATLEQRDELSLTTLTPDDVLWLVYPTAPIDGDAVAAFVDAGGGLFVADDFGRADAVFTPFRLQRVASVQHERTFEGRGGIPVLRPVGDHPLSEEVAEVVANHPSGLRYDGMPVFRFDDGTGLLYDLNLGDGRAVFLSDASVLTNLMLPLRDNARLIANLVDSQCLGRSPCRILLLAEDATLRGRMVDVPDPASRARDLRDRLDRLVERLQSLRPPPATRRALEVFLLIAALIVLTSVFPMLAPSWVGRPRASAEALPPPTELEQAVQRYRSGAKTSFAGPVVLLKHDLERRFYAGLGMTRPPPGPGGRTARRAAAARWCQRHGRNTTREQRQVAAALERFAQLPDRPGTAPAGMSLDVRAFRRYQRDAQRLLAPFGPRDANERDRSTD